VTSGAIGDGMLLSVTSQDEARTRVYTIRTTADRGENFARTADASASSTESSSYHVDNVIDGNNSTETWSGWAANIFPAWVELDFGTVRTFDRVEVFTKKDYEQKGYTLQYWDGAAWADILTVSGNTADHRVHEFAPVTSSRLRVWMNEGNVQQDGPPPIERVARLNEVEVYRSTP
jgi:hypothetical protein